ncbi:hypothetical protein N7520_004850 [Penicillium odoratum]|uniref:uncharacterized protein n=1 Tax=Penicillium odoratum TaxID=1167516 RepID=UPI002546661A|nr:uncharacterized protein N7520_004850 [Penicillium odoratum]KAJ5765291.1 hypothetical protein N7520_004850 [Penicillium odoratum]
MELKSRMTLIVPGLYLGTAGAARDPEMLRKNGINANVSLTHRWSRSWDTVTREGGVSKDRHVWFECADSPTQDLLVHMRKICYAIDRMAPATLTSLTSLPVDDKQKTNYAPPCAPEGILIHCRYGKSRSATMVVAYLMRKFRLPRDDIMKYVEVKQHINPNPGFMRQLEFWEECGHQMWQDWLETIPKAPYKTWLEERAVVLKEQGYTENDQQVRPYLRF